MPCYTQHDEVKKFFWLKHGLFAALRVTGTEKHFLLGYLYFAALNSQYSNDQPYAELPAYVIPFFFFLIASFQVLRAKKARTVFLPTPKEFTSNQARKASHCLE